MTMSFAGSKPMRGPPASATPARSTNAAMRVSMPSTSTVAGRSPSSPSSTARSLPWPRPVAPSEPKSSTFKRAGTMPASARRSAKRRAATIGPTVCELDGPMPILKSSKVPTGFMAGKLPDAGRAPARATRPGSQSQR